MEAKIAKLLKKENIKVELKAYKEYQTNDGYAMFGNLYVNGKKSITCVDNGDGGGVFYEVVHNNGKLLENVLKGETIEYNGSNLKYDVELLFGELASDLVANKQYKTKARTNLLFKTKIQDKNFYTIKLCDKKNPNRGKYIENALNVVLNYVNKNNLEEIFIYNFENSFKSYTKMEIENYIEDASLKTLF